MNSMKTFKQNENIKFIICAIGIFVCYFYFGILQEKITRGQYGDQVNDDGTVGERFTFMLALVGVQCICNWAFVKAIMVVNGEKSKDETHQGLYAGCSLTYLLAMISSNMALRWVPYPTQVVGKSAKPIPVMVLGVLIGRKSYTMQRYLCVLMIVIGVVMFMFKDGKASSSSNTENTELGQLLLILSLTMDGLTGAIQERVRGAHAPSGKQMMLAMNWWSTIMVCLALVLSGEGLEFVAFATRYPYMLAQLATLATAGAFGQLFIFMMVSASGPLACSVVTTTRKFFTVLFSVLFFGNTLIARQWLGAVLVFSGLFADMLFGKGSPKKSVKIKEKEKEALIRN